MVPTSPLPSWGTCLPALQSRTPGFCRNGPSGLVGPALPRPWSPGKKDIPARADASQVMIYISSDLKACCSEGIKEINLGDRPILAELSLHRSQREQTMRHHQLITGAECPSQVMPGKAQVSRKHYQQAQGGRDKGSDPSWPCKPPLRRWSHLVTPHASAPQASWRSSEPPGDCSLKTGTMSCHFCLPQAPVRCSDSGNIFTSFKAHFVSTHKNTECLFQAI